MNDPDLQFYTWQYRPSIKRWCFYTLLVDYELFELPNGRWAIESAALGSIGSADTLEAAKAICEDDLLQGWCHAKAWADKQLHQVPTSRWQRLRAWAVNKIRFWEPRA